MGKVLRMEMDQPAIPTSRTQLLGKSATSLVMLALLMVVLWFLFATPLGAGVRKNPQSLAADIQRFVALHAVAAPLLYLVVYIIFAVLVFPVWWLQILSGIGFGLYEGTFFSLIGSTIGSVIATGLSRWIAADWFHQRVESKMDQLKKLDETLDHNGFLFVMTVRQIHFLPFGLTNYAFGLLRISYRDVMIGTFLGGIPAAAFYVGLGTGYRVWHNWRFDLVLTAITLVLLLPLILRYSRPQWFKKIGVE